MSRKVCSDDGDYRITLPSNCQVHAVNNKKIALHQLSASYYVDTVSSGLKIQIAMVKYLLSVAKIFTLRSREHPSE